MGGACTPSLPWEAQREREGRVDLHQSSSSAEGCFEPVGSSFHLPQPPYAGNSDLELVFFFTSYFFTQVLLTAGPSVWRVHGAPAPLLLLLHEELLQGRRPRLHHGARPDGLGSTEID